MVLRIILLIVKTKVSQEEDVELNLLIGFRALIVFMRCVRITGKYAIYG